LWGTVTAVNPLRVRLDGDEASLPFVPDSLIPAHALTVDARVRVEVTAGRVIVHGSAKTSGLAAYPVGASYESSDPTHPSVLFGGIWETFGAGRVVVGVAASGTFNAVLMTGGQESHVHTSAAHSHARGTLRTQIDVGSDSIAINRSSVTAWARTATLRGQGGSVASETANVSNAANIMGDTASTTPGNTGSSSSLMPYITMYRWRRIG
jgi:hypothetical protein